VAQHSFWIGDLKYSPSLRRLIFDDVDEGLEVIKDFLLERKNRGRRREIWKQQRSEPLQVPPSAPFLRSL
jgi:hypothetical protein